MSKKYGIYCENCNVLLSNEDDIFATNFGQLYHSTCTVLNHGKSTDCQPHMVLKMNIKFGDTPTITTEVEGQCGIMNVNNSSNAARQSVEQLKAKVKTLEDALLLKDRLKDDVHKLMDCIVKLENPLWINVTDKAADIVNNTSQDKSDKQVYNENNLVGDESPLSGAAEERNIEHKDSNSSVLQPAQQPEARIKTLEDALLQTKSDGNNLTDCVQTVEMNKDVDKAPDSGNSRTLDSKANKQTRIESDLGDEQHNDTENVASASEEHHKHTMSEETQEVLDLRWNCVLIRNSKHYCKSLDEAFSYVRELAIEMSARIDDNSVIHIDMEDHPNWYVYFRDGDSKKEFLRNRFIYQYKSDFGRPLRIFDYSDCGIVDIENFQSSDLSIETAFDNVLGLAKKLGVKNIKNSIDFIDVYRRGPNLLVYSVIFNSECIKNVFLKKKNSLKNSAKTKSLTFTDVGGHTLNCYNVDHFNMAAASANVIGVAGLMGLQLSTDSVKRMYILNEKRLHVYDRDVHFSFVVEFSSKDIKTLFLKKKSQLEGMMNAWSFCIDISDIKTEGNIVSIKYYKNRHNVCIAFSYIGLVKELGLSFNPDQIDRFFQLSEFVSKASLNHNENSHYF